MRRHGKRETIGGVAVLVNASPGQIIGLLNRSRHGIVRGLVDGPDAYWWDAYQATHENMGQKLKGKQPSNSEIVEARLDVGDKLYVRAGQQAREHPRVKGFMKLKSTRAANKMGLMARLLAIARRIVG